MRKSLIFGSIGAVAIAGLGIGVVTANTDGLDAWKSGKNNNRLVQVQNTGGVRPDSGKVGIAFFSNSAFKITSPRGIEIMVDPWRNDPSGVWGVWYRMEFPLVDVDIGLSTHAHFDHDALGRLDANMLLDRMAGTFVLGDVKITGIADKHQCVAAGIIPWTEAVKQFEGRENICPPGNYRHLDNSLYLIETGGLRLLMWGDNRPNPPKEVLERIGDVDIVFVPVDGSGHILNYEQADAVVAMTRANIAIPHHYLVPETTFYTSTLDTALEWTKTHEHTLLKGASIEVSQADVKGKSGHVFYFGSNNMVSELAKKK